MDSFEDLETFICKIPGIKPGIGKGEFGDGLWWIKFQIDIAHPLAWSVIQELGHVVNYVSLNEPLPTILYPVSPPPYMNGGPEIFLSWVIESKHKDFRTILESFRSGSNEVSSLIKLIAIYL